MMGLGNGLRILLFVGLLIFSWGMMPVLAQDSTALPNPPKTSWSAVTVTDVSGWRYENVTLWWVGQGQVLRLRRSDGAVRDFAPGDIATITDLDGHDLTAEVAVGMMAPGQPPVSAGRQGTAEPGKNEIGIVETATPGVLAEEIDPKPFTVTFDLELGYALPSGDWFDGAESGLNFGVGLRYSVSQNKHYLRLMYRRQDLGTGSIPDANNQLNSLNVEMCADEFMLLLGVHNSFNQESKHPSMVYGEMGPAAIKYNVAVEDHSYLNNSVTKLGVVFNLGLLVPFNSVVAMDVGVNAVFKPGWSSGSDPGGLLFGAHLGLSIYK